MFMMSDRHFMTSKQRLGNLIWQRSRVRQRLPIIHDALTESVGTENAASKKKACWSA